MDGCLCTRRTFLKGTAALGGSASFGWLPTKVRSRTGPFPTRPLGQTGVHIPILGLGTASLGYGLSSRQSERIVETALDLGVAYLDTAYNYAHAQKDIGQVMKRRRDEAFLVTKTHTTDGRVARLQLEESLRLLNTDHVDVAHIHSVGSLNADRVLQLGGTLDALLKAKEEGLTRFVGVSIHNFPDSLRKVLETGCIEVAMVPVNFADPETHSLEKRLLPLAERHGIGIVGMKVFGGARHALVRGAKSSILPGPLMDLAFRYSLSLASMACVVIGVYSAEELIQDVRRAREFIPLSASEKRSLWEEAHRLATCQSSSRP